MGHDLEALAALNEWFPPPDVSQTLACVLRVPEAWDALGDPEFRQRMLSPKLRSPLTPGKLGLALLGIVGIESLDVSALPSKLADRVDALWSRMDIDSVADRGLEEIQLFGLGLARELNARPDPCWLIKRLQTDPKRWRSPLACAWPAISDRSTLMHQLVQWHDSAGPLLIANSLLANYDLARASQEWPHFPPVMEARAVQTLAEMGERGLAQALSARDPGPAQQPQVRSLFEDPELLLLISAKQQALGDLDAAQFTLDQASQQAGQVRQFMAEQAAGLAREKGDPDLARSAVQSLLTESPSPWMRAKLGLTLIRTGERTGAETILAISGRSIPEDLARAILHLRQGSHQTARSLLARLIDSRTDLALRGDLWIGTLMQAAFELTDPDAMLRVMGTRARIWGHATHVRLELARKFLSWGDPETAAVHATMAASLSPDSMDAQRLLAEALTAGGRPSEAVPVWDAISPRDPSVLEHVIECTLASNDLELARQTLRRLETQPAPRLQPGILLAKIAAADGDLETAEDLLHQFIASSPADPSGWIALSAIFRQCGRNSEAIETLAAGIQAAPESGPIHMAYGEILEENGRLSEALSACERAVALDPQPVDWRQHRGALLLQLGHTQEAIETLRHALKIQPLNLELRRLLAMAYEEAGEAMLAWELIAPLLDNLPADDSPLVGRLATRAAIGGDEDALHTALSSLAIARDRAPNDAQLDYWLGEALLAAGDWQRARASFERCLGPEVGRDRDLFRLASIGYSEAAMMGGKPREALAALERAFEQSAADGRFLAQLSKVHNALGDIEAGLASAELALEIHPLDEDAFHQLRKATRLTGNWSRAIGFVQGLISQHPDNPEIWLRLAQAGIDCADERLSRNALARALHAGRGDPELLERGALLLQEMGLGQSASRILRRAAHLRPGDAGLLERWANLSETLSNFDEALAAWNRLADLAPARPEPLLGAARALWEQGRRGEAIQRLQEALEAFPAEPTIYLALAHGLLEDGRELTALDLFHRAHGRFPDHAQIAKHAGIVTLEHGTPEAALELLKQAIRIQPNDVDVLIALADCCSRLGKHEQSIRILRRVNEREDSPALCAAMLASIALVAGDDQAAAQASASCLRARPANEREYEVLTRALADLGLWEPAFHTAQEWHVGAHSQQSVSSLIRLRLRLADGHWLFTHFCKAVHHGPGFSWVDSGGKDELHLLLQEATALAVEEQLLTALKAHFALCFEELSTEELTRIAEQIRIQSDAQAWEGLAIRYLRDDMPLRCVQLLSDEGFAPLSEAWSPLILGTAFRLLGEHELAEFHLKEAETHLTLRPYANFQLAMSLLEAGSAQGAIGHLNRALSNCPKEAAWHHQLGRLYRSANELGAALPHFQGARDLEPANEEYALGLARSFRDLGQPAAALEVYGRILATSSEESDLWSEAGQVSMLAGDARRALEYFQRATSLSPQDPIALIGYAQATSARGEMKTARELAQKALRLAPHDVSVLLGLARILQSEGRIADALEVCDKASELSPDPLEVRLHRSDLLTAAGQCDQAAHELQGLADERPDDDRIWAALANSLEASGRFDSALEAASRAIRIAPRNTRYRLLLGRLCREAGQLDRALHEMTKVREYAGNDFRLAIELGQVYEARRDYGRALECYRDAISQNPGDAQAFCRAGYVLKALKDYPQAGEMLKRAVELDPKNTLAHHQLAAVRALELVHCTLSEAMG